MTLDEAIEEFFDPKDNIGPFHRKEKALAILSAMQQAAATIAERDRVVDGVKRANWMLTELWDKHEGSEVADEIKGVLHHLMGTITGDAGPMMTRIDALEATIAEQRVIVDKLPKTKDGVAIVPGESVWATDGDGLVLEAYIDPLIWPREGYRTRSWKSAVTYSTREAALAAREGK